MFQSNIRVMSRYRREVVRGCVSAIKDGDLDAVKRFYENSSQYEEHTDYWDAHVCSMAAEHGHLDILIFLHEHGCLWDEQTFTKAVKGGYLDIVKYLDKYVRRIKDSADNIHASVDIYSWNEDIYDHAIDHGHFEIVKFLYENGYPWSEDACLSAVNEGNLEILKYLRENNCPWNKDECIEYAKLHKRVAILEWINSPK